MKKQWRIDKAITELNKYDSLFWGNIADTLEKYKLYDRASAKEVIDYLEWHGMIPTKKGMKNYVYDQLKLRKQQKLKKVI